MSIKQKTLYDKIWRNRPYFEDFITRSIYHSNAIEGNTISYAETYAITFNDNSLKVNATPRELYEAINLKYALNYILNHLYEPISLSMIKEIGILLNKNISDISGFRTTSVYIRGAEHIPPNAADVPRMLMELLHLYESSDKNLFQKIAQFHIGFERIHPFSDGNGRTGRVLITKELLANNFAPIVIPLDERARYMELLATQNINGLASFLSNLNKAELTRMQKFDLKIQQPSSLQIKSIHIPE